MKKLRLFFLILEAYYKRHWKAYTGIVIIIFSLLILSIKYDVNFLRSDSLTEGAIGTYQENDLPNIVTKLISNGLVKMDEHGRAISDLAQGWETNNDATEFTFKLKPNLIWNDGSTIHSSDIAFNIPDVETSYPDSQTILFKLKDSFSAFPSILSDPVFKKGTLIGTGPYRVSRVDKSVIFITKITLVPKDPKLPKIVVRFYPTEKTATTAFSLGEIEALLGVTNINDFQNFKTSSKSIPNYSKLVAILYNYGDPLLGGKNRSLRQALSYSAPIVPNEAKAKTPIPPNSWAYTDQVNDYLGNFEVAKQALGRAKANMNPEDLDKAIILTVSPQLASLGEKVSTAWQGLGLKVAVRVEPGIPQNFQALLITQSIPADPDQYSLWHSTQTKTNLTKYASPRADKDLEDGRKAISEDDRKVKYLDFQKSLLEDSPATFLYFPKFNVVYLKKVENKINLLLPLQS